MNEIKSDSPPQRSDGDKKADSGKLRYDLIPVESLEGIAEIFTYGAHKYDDNNWRKSEHPGRYYAAMCRHIAEIRKGEFVDEESGCFHIDHALVCLIMYRELMIQNRVHPKEKEFKPDPLFLALSKGGWSAEHKVVDGKHIIELYYGSYIGMYAEGKTEHEAWENAVAQIGEGFGDHKLAEYRKTGKLKSGEPTKNQ